MKSLGVVLVVIALTMCVRAGIPFSDLPYCRNLTLESGGTYNLCWGIYGNAIGFSCTIYNVKTWVGIGFHQAGSAYTGMQDGDFVIGLFSGGTFQTADDRYCNCTDEGTPSQDTDVGGEFNLLEYGGSQTDDYTNFYFSRDLVTTDTVADHPISNADLNIVYAHGTINSFTYHQQNRGEAVINFFDPYNY